MRVSIRDGVPVVDVRDLALWARDPRTDRFYGQLSESLISEIYDDVAREFWEDVAPAIAEAHGFASSSVQAYGRAQGWLSVGPQSWLHYTVTDGDGWDNGLQQQTEVPFMIPPFSKEAGADDADIADGETQLAERTRWMLFAEAIDQAVKAAGDAFAERLRERAEDDAHIIKGYN